ncbi:hypothetical protein Pfo_017184 [Paulownia fortunei]|nr:hypothetical protein Pfo_017184 [Paulownia fortunei]
MIAELKYYFGIGRALVKDCNLNRREAKVRMFTDKASFFDFKNFDFQLEFCKTHLHILMREAYPFVVVHNKHFRNSNIGWLSV